MILAFNMYLDNLTDHDVTILLQLFSIFSTLCYAIKSLAKIAINI